MEKTSKIVFFDGVCGLCNSFVDFLIKRNKRGQLKFSPLQGSAAQQLLKEEYTQKLGTIVYYRNGEILTKSTAALRVYADLGGLRSIVFILFIFPRFIRNTVYDYIARNRYKWFGKKESCRIPSPEERQYFID